eukprot:79834-Amorphochlora_amoeboformis.AAC.2
MEHQHEDTEKSNLRPVDFLRTQSVATPMSRVSSHRRNGSLPRRGGLMDSEPDLIKHKVSTLTDFLEEVCGSCKHMPTWTHTWAFSGSNVSSESRRSWDGHFRINFLEWIVGCLKGSWDNRTRTLIHNPSSADRFFPPYRPPPLSTTINYAYMRNSRGTKG